MDKTAKGSTASPAGGHDAVADHGQLAPSENSSTLISPAAVSVTWPRRVPPDFAGVTRADRQGGSYLRYHPDMPASASNTLGGEVLEYAADVSTALGRLGERLRSNPLPILYSTIIRSESISSSWIEGIRENPRAIAIAQIGDGGASHNASSVIRNVDATSEAIEFLGVGVWTHEDVLDIRLRGPPARVGAPVYG